MCLFTNLCNRKETELLLLIYIFHKDVQSAGSTDFWIIDIITFSSPVGIKGSFLAFFYSKGMLSQFNFLFHFLFQLENKIENKP